MNAFYFTTCMRLPGNSFKRQYERGMDPPHRKFQATAHKNVDGRDSRL